MASDSKLYLDREGFLAQCALEATEITEADKTFWASVILSPVGKKILGHLQLETSRIGAKALGVSLETPDYVVARRLAMIQGEAIAYAAIVDTLLDFAEPTDAT